MMLINNFHRTSYNSRLITTRQQLDDLEYRLYSGEATDSEKSIARRIRTALCPSHSQGCKCGGTMHVDDIR